MEQNDKLVETLHAVLFVLYCTSTVHWRQQSMQHTCQQHAFFLILMKCTTCLAHHTNMHMLQHTNLLLMAVDKDYILRGTYSSMVDLCTLGFEHWTSALCDLAQVSCRPNRIQQEANLYV